MKTIIFRLTVASLAFTLGLSIFYGLYWFQTRTTKLITVEKTAESLPTDFKAVPRPPSEDFVDENNDFDKEGYYYIIGETPKEFADFNEFYLQIWDYNEKTDELYLIKPTGFLLKNEKEVKLNKVFLGRRNVSFETKLNNGISYQFKGNFVQKVYVFEEDRVYLEGTLKKFKNGKKVAEKEFKFGWYVDGC